MGSFAGLPQSAPEAAGFDPNRLSHIVDGMREAVGDGHVLGVVTVVARHGKAVQSEVGGELLLSRLFETQRMPDSDFYCPPDKHGRLATDQPWVPQGSMFVHDPVKTAQQAPPRPDRRQLSEGGAAGKAARVAA